MIPTFDHTSFSENFGAELLCPNCRGNYLHHEKVEVFGRKEDDPQGVHVTVSREEASMDSIMEGNPSMRRHGLKIHFSCEFCPAIPVLSILQHKGNTFVDMDYSLPEAG